LGGGGGEKTKYVTVIGKMRNIQGEGSAKIWRGTIWLRSTGRAYGWVMGEDGGREEKRPRGGIGKRQILIRGKIDCGKKNYLNNNLRQTFRH